LFVVVAHVAFGLITIVTIHVVYVDVGIDNVIGDDEVGERGLVSLVLVR
jgi:hypothetical protein